MADSIGQIGLGSVGRELVPHLVKAYGTVTLHDRDASRAKAFGNSGGNSVASPRAVAQASDIVLLSLPDPAAVRAVLMGADGILADEKTRCGLIIDTTTSDPATAREMEATAKARGVAYVEAPISTPIAGMPGPAAARTGNATFLVGAEPGDFERAKAVLSHLGRHIFHVGAVGQGSAMKLVTNYIAGATRVAIAEGFALAASMGIPCARTAEICRHAAAASQTLEEVITQVIEGDLNEVNFSVDLRYKDFRLTGELAREMGVPMPLNAYIVELYQMMRARGMGAMEMNNMVPFVAGLAGVDIFKGGKKARA
jgi:3-hydroxyisobutyrate dehydrogenase-like beta-hydroxyacid dehydrogenase